ncbi:VRR-NUC domain-containing protein [Ligilactobacillus ruminis]|uniref:VRR-NUC domain-containing protein n=1 Tax=Ligilactobacillus ruminis TaxID=1623 RepID=UPI0022E13F5C|nr:VRR-NUC domain-containing protein [Ligilactobacillus ruminis]
MSPEHKIQNEIQIALSENGCRVFRANVGKVRLEDGRWFDTGLPKGHPDLYGFRINDGKVFYIEVKTATGRPRPDQITFHKMLNRYGITHGIARSADDAVKIVKKGLVGYGF